MDTQPVQAPIDSRNQLIADMKLVIYFTSNWLFFGCYGFAVFCSLVAAAKGILQGA